MTAAPKSTPPPDVEAALVGALLEGDTALIDVAAEILLPDDLSDPRCAAIYTAILALDEQGRRVDPITVVEVLKGLGRLSEVGGPSFLAALPSPAVPNVAEWAKAIRDQGARRRLAQVARQMAELARDETVPLATVLDEAGNQFNDLLTKRQRASFIAAPQLLEETLALLDAQKHGSKGITTGLPDVDRALGSPQPGDLVVLAARPGVGKTALALQWAYHVAQTASVAVFSLEMSRTELMKRLLAAEARVDLRALTEDRLSLAEENRVADAAQRIYGCPRLHVDDDSQPSPLDIRAKARRLKQQHPDLALLVIDYLTLIKPRGRYETRQAEVAEISRALKSLAKDLDLPILVLSQLNRKVEERKGPPILSDLRESGAIEQDADTVAFLHCEEEDEEKKRAAVALEVEFIVAKQRNGPTGSADLVFLKPTVRFEGRARGA